MAELARIHSRGGDAWMRGSWPGRGGDEVTLVFSGESTGARAASLASDMHRLGRARSL
jgi:hypothetical protein